MKAAALVIGALAVGLSNAAGVWEPCGAGAICNSGLTCVRWDSGYSQCCPANPAGNPPGGVTTVTETQTQTTTATTTTTTTTTTGGGTITSTRTITTTPAGCTPTGIPETCENRQLFRYFGVNQAGAEFGPTKLPGSHGTDYAWPTIESLDYFFDLGYNTIRLPFLLERMAPLATGLTGELDPAYLGTYRAVINYITSKGGYAVIDPHNNLRYNGTLISTSAFSGFWWTLASAFKDNNRVIFDLINEPNGIPASDAFERQQAAVFTIRAAGATTQLVLVQGTAWSGAWSWISSGNAAAFATFQDPSNNFAFDMHQYFDGDSSGTGETCVSPTIGAERLADATAWLRTTNFKGFLGQFGAGSNDVCIAAVKGALCAMQQSDVWLGATYWAAGPLWADHFMSLEPPNGAGISRILPEALNPYLTLDE